MESDSRRPCLALGLLALAAALAACRATGQASVPAEPVRLHVDSLGTGEPVVLLHGFGATSFTWRHLAPELAEDHQVFLVDLKGHGRSPKPPDDRYSLYDQADLVRGWIAARDLREVTLVGNSYGGGVALVTALRLRGTDRLKRLVLLDTVAYEQPLPFFVALLRLPLLGPVSLALISPECAARLVLEKTFHDDDKIPPSAVREYAAPLREPGGRHAMIEAARQAIPSDVDRLVAEYPELGVPTLIVWGRDDEIVPVSIGRRLAKALPRARMAILPECGHAPQEECPELVVALVRVFLEEARMEGTPSERLFSDPRP